MRASSVACGVCAVVAIITTASSARADFELQASFTSGVSWRRALPALSTESSMTAAREVRETRVPIGGSLAALGASFDLGMTVDDRWTIPTLGMGAYGAVGSYDTIVTSADGSIAHARPWTTYELDLLMPGIGYRAKERRFMFSASLRTGVTYLHANGSVAGGGGETLTSLTGTSFLLQAEIEACRRLDPVTRVCLQVAPRIYDFGFMNGATLGLRIEWGR